VEKVLGKTGKKEKHQPGRSYKSAKLRKEGRKNGGNKRRNSRAGGSEFLA